MAKLGIIGAGHVGEIVAYTRALRGGCTHITLHDINDKRLDGVVSDLEDATGFYPHNTHFVAGTIEDVAASDMIVVCRAHSRRRSTAKRIRRQLRRCERLHSQSHGRRL